eukprot:554585-Prymnesium_polylepis.1
MCAHEVLMRDARSSADRGAIALVHVDTPRESALARWASSSEAVTPGGEDASPGHAGELVARLCVVYSVRT